MLNFQDQTVIITGAAGGIGKSICKKFLSFGANIVLIDRDKNLSNILAEIDAPADRALTFVGDITDKLFLEQMAKTIIEKFSTIDVLINNAGITKDNFLVNITEADWDAVIDVNLKGAFLCCQAVFPHMKEKNFGKIINIISASWLGNIGQANYSASKGGLVGLTRTLAKECARYNINVNGVSPGLINTPMVQTIPEKVLNELINARPLKRIGEPADIANAVGFLASKEADYITGQILNVDGGKSVGA